MPTVKWWRLKLHITTSAIICSSWGRFHQHFRANFLRAKFDFFFRERRLGNGAQIWRILSLKFGFTILKLIVGEIEQRIFCQMLCAGVFCLAKKFGEIDPLMDRYLTISLFLFKLKSFLLNHFILFICWCLQLTYFQTLLTYEELR